MIFGIEGITPHIFISLLIYASVSSGTPGPNNMMLLASGMNFGFRRTIPHMLGISIGFSVVLLALGLGLGEVFRLYPITYITLKYAGAAYMVYLSWQIANAKPPQTEGTKGAKHKSLKPMSFIGAAAFQWVNPKAMIMAATYFSAYVPLGDSWQKLAFVIGLYTPVNLICISLWAILGVKLADYLGVNRNRKIFNYTMAGLLLLSLAPILWE
ncbi:MAG: LysE family translocator [Candidatus Pacebacteria bacterium]|nr:LysE family translocator [Candidatus Paceibacterota bacterium]